MFDKNPWFAGSLRLTIFTMPGMEPPKVPLWEQVVGQAPENSVIKNRANIIEESGEFEGNILAVTQVPTRIDWVFLPRVEGDSHPEQFPVIGSFKESVHIFQKALKAWLNNFDSILRIAFGASLILPKKSHKECYLALNELLPSVAVDPESSDFNYQINRKRGSATCEGIILNRISKWRAIKNIMRINGVEMEPIYACHLEFDMNNVPDHERPIRKELIFPLFSELLDLCFEISMKGDIP